MLNQAATVRTGRKWKVDGALQEHANIVPKGGKRQANLKHILSSCRVSLTDGRFQWRHDQVLAQLTDGLEKEKKRKGTTTKVPASLAFLGPGRRQASRTEGQGLWVRQMTGKWVLTLAGKSSLQWRLPSLTSDKTFCSGYKPQSRLPWWSWRSPGRKGSRKHMITNWENISPTSLRASRSGGELRIYQWTSVAGAFLVNHSQGHWKC